MSETLPKSEHPGVWHREIFDSIHDAVFVHDPVTGRIESMNRRAEAMWGIRRDEVGMPTIGEISANVPPYTQVEAFAWIRRMPCTCRRRTGTFGPQTRTSLHNCMPPHGTLSPRTRHSLQCCNSNRQPLHTPPARITVAINNTISNSVNPRYLCAAIIMEARCALCVCLCADWLGSALGR